MKVLPSKMVVKPSSVSAAGDQLTAPTRRIAMREMRPLGTMKQFFSLIFLCSVLAVFAVLESARLRFWISAVGVGHQRGWTIGGEFVGIG